MSDRDPLAVLSPEQILTVMPILLDWRRLNKIAAVRCRLQRIQLGAIPTWGIWSNIEWVKQQSTIYRRDHIERPGYVHVSLMMHLALPPGWYKKTACQAEADAQRRYGYWKNELTWIPPKIVDGTEVWIRRND